MPNKRKKTKRILAILLMLLILALSVPVAFGANVVASGTCGPNATWSIDSNRVLTIRGTGVVTSSDYSNYCSQFSSSFDNVVIEDGITEFARGVVFSSKGAHLESITIPPSLQKMAAYSINETYFEKVYISDLAAWSSIVFDGSYSNPLCWGGDLFLNGGLIAGDFVFPDTVNTLNAGTFSQNENITSVTIPGTVKTVGAFDQWEYIDSTSPLGVFEECENLERAVLKFGVQAIDPKAFSKCKNLSAVELPNSLQTIGVMAFSDCSSLTGISIPESVQEIQDRAFSCSGLTEIKLPNSLQTIGEGAFSVCPFTSISIPENVQEIQAGAFYGDLLMTDVEIWNPSCAIADDFVFDPEFTSLEEAITVSVFPNGVTIHGHSGSTAEAYANSHGCAFVAFDGEEHTHTYTSAVTTPATCKTKGVMTYTCICGDSYTEEIVIDPNNHAAPDENGDCPRCGKHIKDVEKPTEPQNEEPAPKQNFFQRIIQWFKNLFAKLFGR